MLLLFLTGVFLLAFGSDPARAATSRGAMGVHVGGFHGGPRVGMRLPRPAFAHIGFPGRRFVRGRHGRRGFFPYVDGGSYYDDGYGYDEGYQYNPRGAPRSGYCDVSSNAFPQFCVWKEGP